METTLPAIIPAITIIRLTPPGRGAVGTFLLCGEGVADIFLPHWHGRATLGDRPVWGRLQLNDAGECEEAVVCQTADDAIEIHIHGGDQIASAIETLFERCGAVRKTWQEHFKTTPTPPKEGNNSSPSEGKRFAQQNGGAVLPEKSLPQIQTCFGASQRDVALQLLPFAPTERTAQILLDQYNGAFDREKSAIEQLQLSDPEERQRRMMRLHERAQLGKHLVEPFRVVLAGASNAGKSSLLNAILGFQRSLVHSLPGTTRDVVSGQTALDGFPVTFFDTAGFRATGDDLELQGINRSLRSLADADLVVWVIDLTVEESQRPVCPVESNVLFCCNKIDLAGVSETADGRRQTAEDFAGIPVSALTGEGIETLLDEVIRRLVPHPPEPGDAVPLCVNGLAENCA